MNHETAESNDHSYLFKVDILVEAKTNGEALEQLLRVLNGSGFADYRIDSGIDLGQIIEAALALKKKKPEPAAAQAQSTAASNKAKIAAAVEKAKEKAATTKSGAASSSGPDSSSSRAVSATSASSDELEKRIRNYIETNKLIRLSVNKGRGVKLSMPCRIISFDARSQLLTAYHVDDKQVHSFNLFEIDDFME